MFILITYAFHGCRKIKYLTIILLLLRPAPIAQLVECPLRGTGGHGFDPDRDRPKSLKMVLAAPRLALRFTG